MRIGSARHPFPPLLTAGYYMGMGYPNRMYEGKEIETDGIRIHNLTNQIPTPDV